MKTITRAPVPLLLAAAVLTALFLWALPAASAETAAGALDTILTVGTTQAFSDEAVPEADVRAILQAGLAAESAINQQPWFFVAVTDRDVMAELSVSGGMPGGGGKPFPPADGAPPAMPQGAPPAPMGGGAKAALGDSPLAILVYADRDSSSPNPDFDCGLAVQNMYIAAASLGYGAKVVSSPTMTLNGEKHDQICQLLGVAPSLSAVAVLLIGRPDESVDGVTGATARAGLEEKTVIIG